jgi:hypothetical protein
MITRFIRSVPYQLRGAVPVTEHIRRMKAVMTLLAPASGLGGDEPEVVEGDFFATRIRVNAASVRR